MRKLIAAVILIALAGCGGSKLPDGAEKKDPPEVVAEYARIAKLTSCDDVYRAWDLHWGRYQNLKPGIDPWTDDAGWAYAAARRGKKLRCSPWDRD